MNFLQRLEGNYPNIAYVYAISGYLCMAVLQTIFKYVTQTISPFQALYLRAVCLFCVSCFILRKGGQTPYIKQSRLFRLVLIRLIFSSSYVVIIHYCLKYLPISTVSTLSNTAPIFIFFIEAIYYKKSLNKINLCLTILSFIGVILIIQPDFIFHGKHENKIQNFQFLSFLVIVGAFCFSVTLLFVHDLSKSISCFVNLHYSYLSHLILTGILINFQNPVVLFDQINAMFILTFILLVIFALFTQNLIFAATSLKKPSHTMPFGYLTIVATFLADLFVFNIQFDLLQVIGIALTSVGLLSKFLVSEEPETTKVICAPENLKENLEYIKMVEKQQMRKSQMQETQKVVETM